MTITVTAKMLREKNACSSMRFIELFGDSVELTVGNLKIAYEHGLYTEWFFEKFPELIKKLNRSEVIDINLVIAYFYAKYIDKGPSDDTRKAACDDCYYAYWYALYVDCCPHDVTRKGVLDNPEKAYRYAKFVDCCPSDDTRKAACLNPEYTYLYAICVDRCARDDTREAAYKEIYWGRRYDNWFVGKEV